MPKKNSRQGLTSEEARKRLKEFGPNQLRKEKDFSSFKLFLSQFKSPLIYILVFAGLVTLFLRDFTDSIVIFAAVFLNTLLGFYQERKAQKSLAALRSLLALKARVIRSGEQKEIDATLIVPGDLVILTIGSRVPADGILVEATDFSVNEAILTGESMPVSKLQIANSKSKKENLVFMGTTVVTGIAKMEVTQTGMETEMGKIGKSLEEVKEEETPLQIQLGKLARIIAFAVGAITLLIFLLGGFLGYELLEMFTMSVAIAVAAIPEGLVVTLTVILALGMQRILKRKAIVRKLIAAETLGAVSIICADKTGTLTEGEMRVVDSAINDQLTNAKQMLIKAAILCNDMRDPLEIGMWRFAEDELKNLKTEKFKNPNDILKAYPRLEEIPFSPDYKYIATLHRRQTGPAGRQKKGKQEDGYLLVISGAPEVILNKCQIENTQTEIWLKKFQEYGEKGYRLVGFGYQDLKSQKAGLKHQNLKDFAWLGILIYEDPVRKGVKEALKECQQAGIKVKVITGDYASTAIAVLKQLDFEFDPKTQVIEGAELEDSSGKELARKVNKGVLFARTTPEQKLKIVQLLKEKGEVVAMTGDGVNDAPALKQSDIGIVVEGASDVAKETTDIVLLDSNFATIVHAVEEGRAIFENIKKVVLYLLSGSFTEIILIGGSLFLGLPLPLTAAQILWVNLAEDSLPAMALAFEQGEKDTMNEPPRQRSAPILDTEIKTLILIVGIIADTVLLFLFYWLNKGFFHFQHIQTVMFVALSIGSLFIAISCRSLRKSIWQKSLFDNKLLLFSLAISFSLLILGVHLPALQRLLSTQALNLKEWLFLVSFGIFNLVLIELTKWVFIVQKKRWLKQNDV